MTALSPAEAARRFPNDPDLAAHAALRSALMEVDKDEVDSIVGLLAGEGAYRWLGGAVVDKVSKFGYFTPFQVSPKLMASFDDKLTPRQARGAAFECARLFREAGFKTERNEKGYPLWRVS